MPLKYEYRRDHDGEPTACGCCEAIAPLEIFEGHGFEPRQLCELCATTMASVAAQYPDQYKGEVATLKAICFVGNAILDAITKRRFEESL